MTKSTEGYAFVIDGQVIAAVGSHPLQAYGRLVRRLDSPLCTAKTSDFTLVRATRALIAAVEELGGDIVWDYLPGSVACLPSEVTGSGRCFGDMKH